MSGPTQADPRPLESKAELIEALSSGEKPRQDWRIGTEHEKFVFHQARPSSLGAAQQSGMQGARASYASGIRPLLEALKSLGWAPIEDQGNLVGLTQNGAAISLEPGGQFELSGATLESLHQTCDEAHRHLAELKPLWKRCLARWAIQSHRSRRSTGCPSPATPLAPLHAAKRRPGP